MQFLAKPNLFSLSTNGVDRLDVFCKILVTLKDELPAIRRDCVASFIFSSKLASGLDFYSLAPIYTY